MSAKSSGAASLVQGVFRGLGDTAAPLRATLLANAVNLLLDPLLMFRLELGVRGAAYATVAAEVNRRCEPFRFPLTDSIDWVGGWIALHLRGNGTPAGNRMPVPLGSTRVSVQLESWQVELHT